MNVRCFEGYRVCFGMRGVVLCMSPDVEIVPDAGCLFNLGGKQNGDVGGKE